MEPPTSIGDYDGGEELKKSLGEDQSERVIRVYRSCPVLKSDIT